MLVEKLAQGFPIRVDHALYYESTQQRILMNGWANYETWNASLWIQNTEGLYALGQLCDSYQQFVDAVRCDFTFDGVRWDDPNINHAEMDDMLTEL